MNIHAIHDRIAKGSTRQEIAESMSRRGDSRSAALPHAVRRALRIGAGVFGARLALGMVPIASAAPFPAEIELSTLLPANGGDGSAGFVLALPVPDEELKLSSVSGAGDVDGDGIDDLMIGDRNADPGGAPRAETKPGQNYSRKGESYVVFGRATGSEGNFPAEIELSSLLPANGGDGSDGFVLNGIDRYDYSGRSASNAGDVNGDGIDDFVIGAHGADPDGRSTAGESYVVFGRDTAQGGNFDPEFPLASLATGDGSAGFVLNGIDAEDHSGYSVTAAGDINGDGIGDLAIGAYAADPDGHSKAGESYVVFGRDTAGTGNFPAVFQLGSLLPANGGDGSAGFVLSGIDVDDLSGCSISAAGDINGDGVDDLVIGACAADSGAYLQAGASYVVFGRDTSRAGNFPAVFPLASLASGDGGAGFVLTGTLAERAGTSVSAAGDINGDDVNDVIIGAPNASPGGVLLAGSSYVVFGRNTAGVGNFPPVFELASLLPANGGDGSTGFALHGFEYVGFSGHSVSDAADVNGDGIDDLIIGAQYADYYSGESYVVFGRDAAQVGNFPAEFELSSLLSAYGGDGSEGFVLRSHVPAVFDEIGYSVSGAGDVNGDGVNDIIVGSRGQPLNYVLFGRKDTDKDQVIDALDNCILIANPDQRDTNGDGYGNICDPDLNNDGFVNFSDLGMMKSLFFSTDADADLDGNGSVSFADLGTLKAFFFLPPGPSGLVQ